MSEEFCKSVIDSEMRSYPFPHFVVEDALSKSELTGILSDLQYLETYPPTTEFNSEYGRKREWKNFPSELDNLNAFLEYLSGEEFIDILKTKFGILGEAELFPDLSYDGGGYVISPPGSFLGYHADFNFSSSNNMYRVINVLVYMNSNYSEDLGGILHLLDPVSKTVEKVVQPKLGTLLAFFTDDTSIHGVTRNRKNFFRRSFNLYYYAKVPLSSNQSSVPHKTIWLNFDQHGH